MKTAVFLIAGLMLYAWLALAFWRCLMGLKGQRTNENGYATPEDMEQCRPWLVKGRTPAKRYRA